MSSSEFYLKCKRLKYLKRLLRSDQILLLKMLCVGGREPGTWFAAIVADLQWLCDVLLGKFEELGRPSTNLSTWLEFIYQASVWPSILSKAMKVAAQESQTIPSIVHGPPAVDDQQGYEDSVVCFECGATVDCFHDLRNHAHRSHGNKNPCRYRTPTRVCLICLTMFGSRNALIAHLSSHGKPCAELLCNLYEPLPADIVATLDEYALRAAKISNGRKRAPAVRLQGPWVSIDMPAAVCTFSSDEIVYD